MIEEIIKIPVFMVNEDAKKFLEFQKHYDLISILLKNEVYNMKYGNVQLNFSDGNLMSVTKNETIWKKS